LFDGCVLWPRCAVTQVCCDSISCLDICLVPNVRDRNLEDETCFSDKTLIRKSMEKWSQNVRPTEHTKKISLALRKQWMSFAIYKPGIKLCILGIKLRLNLNDFVDPRLELLLNADTFTAFSVQDNLHITS